MRSSYELRANVTAYDATCIALAEVLGCELLTGDARLAPPPGLAARFDGCNSSNDAEKFPDAPGS
jgi:hypothetical protein